MASDALPRPTNSADDSPSSESDSSGSSPIRGPRLSATNQPWYVPWLFAAGRFLWFFFVALIVQWPYRAAYHAFDDRYLQFLIGLLQTDRLGWLLYLGRPLEGHFVPVWKFIYFMQWTWFGSDPGPWHLNIMLVHVVTACLLYALLARYLKSPRAAFFGATVWSAVAIGRWDNPFAWLATGQIPWSCLWLLTAMLCQSMAIETGRRLWVVATVVSVTLAVLTWGAALALSIVLPWQLWLVEPIGNGKARRSRMLIVWVGTFAALAVVTLAALLPHMVSSDTERSIPEVGECISRLLAQMSVTFGTLAGWGYTSEPTEGLAEKRIAAIIALLAVVLLPRANRRVLALFLGLAFVHLALVDVFRADVGFKAAVGWGRYLYFATLAWSVVAAVAVDALLRLTRSRLAWGMVVGAAILIPLHIVHQRAIATDTMVDFFVFYDDEYQHFVRQAELARWLEGYARSQGVTLSLPDMPLDIRPAKDVYFPLSAFLALVAPGEVPNLTVARGRDMVDINVDEAQAIVARSDSPLAPQWRENIGRTVDLIAHLNWLSELAVESGTTFRVPERTFRFDDLSFPMSHLVGMNFSEGLPGIQLLVGETLEVEAFGPELDQLAGQTGVSARWWEEVYRNPGSIVVECE